MNLRRTSSWAAAAAVAAMTLIAGPAATAQAATPTADARLARAVDRYSRSLGVKRRSLADVKAAALPSPVANRLSAELEQLYRCDVVTRANLDIVRRAVAAGLPDGTPPPGPTTQRAGDTVLGFPVPDAPNPEVPEHFPFETAVRLCGQAVVQRLDALRAELAGRSLPASSALNLWPVLRFSPGNGNHTYVHDYVLLVETGGHNSFFNNAGGSGLDVWRGPAGSGAKIVAPARGCRDAFDIIRKRTCTLASAALLVMQGDNRFGRTQSPVGTTDEACTNDPVERRVYLQGAGVAGVGAVIAQGDRNTYIGKVFAQGSGHIGGYGYLRADGSDNRYWAVRTSQGGSVVGGIGTFIANGDRNTYGYYVPAAKDPAAEPGQLGSGGVVNDLNGCDAGSSLLHGAGGVGGVGVFRALGVGNSYTAPVNSLGSGTTGGKGTFLQEGGGDDTYAGPGAEGRDDNVAIAPTDTNNGTFIDR
jgi:hypothetical protein